jgi:UDP-N-acetylglucosamine--N-acetylmuramyl-(pentapeptide) pyrophosphoryl-undecaprenol N-acetylglucosamine transferase
VTDNHQEKNARVLEAHGAAMVIREADCTGESLYEAAKSLLQQPETLRAMRAAARSMAVVDSAEQILDVIRELVR